jgi:Tol biopolymer transport system component
LSDAGGGDNLWVMNVDGSDAHAVTKEDFRLLNNPVWHPSGNYLLARKLYRHAQRRLGRDLAVRGGCRCRQEQGRAAQREAQLAEGPGRAAISPTASTLYYSQDTTPGRSFEYNKDSNGAIYTIFRQDLKDGASSLRAGRRRRVAHAVAGRQYLAFVRRVRNQSTLFLKDLASGRSSRPGAACRATCRRPGRCGASTPASPGCRAARSWWSGPRARSGASTRSRTRPPRFPSM